MPSCAPLRQRLADETAAKAKLVAENKQLRKINEVLAGEVYHCRKHHNVNAPMASDYTGIVYHAPPTFESEDRGDNRNKCDRCLISTKPACRAVG